MEGGTGQVRSTRYVSSRVSMGVVPGGKVTTVKSFVARKADKIVQIEEIIIQNKATIHKITVCYFRI